MHNHVTYQSVHACFHSFNNLLKATGRWARIFRLTHTHTLCFAALAHRHSLAALITKSQNTFETISFSKHIWMCIYFPTKFQRMSRNSKYWTPTHSHTLRFDLIWNFVPMNMKRGESSSVVQPTNCAKCRILYIYPIVLVQFQRISPPFSFQPSKVAI